MAAWLAVLALLVQAIVPGHVIAGAHAPPADLGVLDHAHSDGTGPGHEPDPADHERPHCPFCLVHKVGALLPYDPAVGPRLADDGPAVLPIGADFVPVRHFLTCVLCRAPPHGSTPA